MIARYSVEKKFKIGNGGFHWYGMRNLGTAANFITQKYSNGVTNEMDLFR